MAVRFSVWGTPLDHWANGGYANVLRYFIIIINTLFEIGKKFT